MPPVDVPTPVAPSDLLPRRLTRHAANRPDDLAYRFIGRTGRQPVEIAWGDLWSDAHATAAALGGPGQHVGIACEDGRDFIVGLAACWIAGSVAVPFPTALSRRSAPRTEAVLGAAAPGIVLTPPASSLDAWLAEVLATASTAPVVRHAPAVAPDPDGAAADAESLALIQFTSGSTGRPRGIGLTHGNIASNCAAIAAAYDLSAATRGLSWLPLHHDMGLVGHILTPMWLGCRSTVIDPLRFLQRPLSWLRLVGPEGSTITSAPNFAFQMCAKAAETEPLDGINLSSLATVVCGGEPVLATTVTRFLAAVADAGLSPAAFAPSYGLAEATLLVAGTRGPSGPSFVPVPLATGADAVGGSPAPTVADLGPPVAGVSVRIVGEDGRTLPEGVVGEIEIAGPSVGRPVAADGSLAAAAPLATGDLGFLSAGRLRVAGRRKELIILRGQNVYPSDVEAAAGEADPAIAAGGVAAVGLDADGTQKLVVMVEIDRKRVLGPEELASLRKAVSEEVSRRVGHVPAEVLVLKFGTLPRTTSGKIRRGDAVARYVTGAMAGALVASTASRQTDLVDVPNR